MAYNEQLAKRVRDYLKNRPGLNIEEKKMFGGLAFLINGKMCVNVSGDRLMCRFDPKLKDELSQRPGYETMIMRGREYKGYCYIHPEGFSKQSDFEFWINLCLEFNEHAKSSKR